MSTPEEQNPPTAYVPPPTAAPVASGLTDNVAAAIAYLTIIPAIIFLILEPYNKIPFVRFHSWQSIALGVVAFVVQIAVSCAQVFLHFIPLSWMLFSLIHLAIGLVIFLAWLMAIIKASRGEWYKLPIIGDFAEKQARS